MPRHSRSNPDVKLTPRQYAHALRKVAVQAYSAAPFAVFIKITGSVINSVLPIIATLFAGLTTTELARAYNGEAGAEEQALLFVVITAVLGVGTIVWGSIEQYFDHVTKFRIDSAISDGMYEHFLALDFWRYDDKDTADAFDKARQFAQFFGYIFDRLADMLTQLITMVAGVVALSFISPWLGLILIIAIIPSLLVQIRLSQLESRHWRDTIETRRRKDMIEWTISEPKQLAELRLYSMARYLLNLREKLRDADEKHRISFERKFIPRRLFTQMLEAAAEVIALIFTALQIIAHAQVIGQFFVVQQVLSRALGGARGFAFGLGTIGKEMANLFEYQRFMELPVGGGSHRKLERAPSSIEVSNVSFNYPKSKVKVLDDVSLTITAGQHVAIVGENGAGKSTLIKIMTGLYAPSSGSILLDGTSLSDLDVRTWHDNLSVLGQQYLAYGFASARDNVTYGSVNREPNGPALESALTKAEAASFLHKLPKGLDTYLSPWMEHADHTPGVNLSGGQWQRVALARSFYRNAPVVILDEPTSAIDALAESKIFDHLFMDTSKTLITISHRLTTVKKADIIFVLKDGKLVEQGVHDHLVNAKGAYYKMFQSQL